jgi:GNAT superfamily N-acetyltransferase
MTSPADADGGAFSLRLVGADGFELLVRTRLDFALEHHPAPDPAARAALEQATRNWLRGQLAAGNYLGVVGEVAGQAVCCAGLLLYDLPPLVGRLERRVGHLLNFYTYPEWRRRGFGRAMIGFIKEEARVRGIGQLVLNATAMGEPLYRQAGFAEPDCAALRLEFAAGN